MFCNKCGKELPDGSKFCNYCGAQMPDAAPRHARSDPEEIYSFSDENARSEYDVSEEMTKVYGPDDGLDQTKVYNFEAFEEKPGSADNTPAIDEREIIDDSFDNYTEDDTFMDKMDKKFRRDDYGRPPQKKSNTWIWVVLGILAVVLIGVIAVLAVNGINKNADKNPTKPTAATTATQKATEKPTQKPTQKPTEKPKPTQAPRTEAPATQPPQTEPPVTEAPQTEAPPVTEAPAPTDAPEPVSEAVEYY